jgi:hypothetical protein
VAATPDPPLASVAGNVIETGEPYRPVVQALPLQAIEVVGATPSIWTDCDFTASAFPATSTEKNLTVRVWVTLKAPV